MLRASWGIAADRLAGAEVAVVALIGLGAWLVAFELYVEPRLRRWVGGLTKREVVWVAAGPLRVWGSRGPPREHGREGLLAVVGIVLVLAAATLPVIEMHFAAQVLAPGREGVRASAYLTSVPLMAIFSLRVMWHRDGSEE